MHYTYLFYNMKNIYVPGKRTVLLIRTIGAVSFISIVENNNIMSLIIYLYYTY